MDEQLRQVSELTLSEWLSTLAAIITITAALLAFVKRDMVRIRFQKLQRKTLDALMARFPGVGGYWIVQDGLQFIIEQIELLKRNGGTIFTTAIFENYRQGDRIRQALTDPVQSNRHRVLSYSRLVLLDDPSQEFGWMRDFLGLSQSVVPSNAGYVLKPKVLHVRNRNRPLIRYLAKSIPHVSVTLIRFDEAARTGQWLTYFGFASLFGLAFTSRSIYEKTSSYVEEYRSRARLYTKETEVPTGLVREGSLIRRIQDNVLELAEYRDDVIHVGVFGSRALVLRQKIHPSDHTKQESDLDLLMVVSADTDIGTDFRNEVAQRLESERLEDDPPIEIEWSNLDGKYYEQRNALHIDIQLHRRGDSYYVDEAELLGYSIFGDSYLGLYSMSNEYIGAFIDYPERIPCLKDRCKLVLESSEFGIETAVLRVADFVNYHRTDPRRVLWIQLSNALWAISGKRPQSQKQAIDYLLAQHSCLNISMSRIDAIQELLGTDIGRDLSRCQHARKNTKDILKTLCGVLKSQLP